MSINLTITADVIDIRSDVPCQDDIFLVDSNVWLWQTYTNIATAPRATQKIQTYTPYLSKARRNDATLVYTGLILSELAHVIERTECGIYNQANRTSLSLKEDRHNLVAERAKVVAEVKSAWQQIARFAVHAELNITEDTMNAALTRFQTQALDGYDLLLLEAMGQADAGQIKAITDDMDYAVVPDIQLFTGNNRVIQPATAQGKLLRR